MYIEDKTENEWMNESFNFLLLIKLQWHKFSRNVLAWNMWIQNIGSTCTVHGALNSHRFVWVHRLTPIDLLIRFIYFYFWENFWWLLWFINGILPKNFHELRIKMYDIIIICQHIKFMIWIQYKYNLRRVRVLVYK